MSAQRVVELYSDMETRGQIDWEVAVQTTDRGPFHPWLRLKQPRGTVRVVIDEADDVIIAYAALPRLSDTYDDVVNLLKRYRRRINEK